MRKVKKEEVKGKSKMSANSPIDFYLRDTIRDCKNRKVFLYTSSI